MIPIQKLKRLFEFIAFLVALAYIISDLASKSETDNQHRRGRLNLVRPSRPKGGKAIVQLSPKKIECPSIGQKMSTGSLLKILAVIAGFKGFQMARAVPPAPRETTSLTQPSPTPDLTQPSPTTDLAQPSPTADLAQPSPTTDVAQPNPTTSVQNPSPTSDADSASSVSFDFDASSNSDLEPTDGDAAGPCEFDGPGKTADATLIDLGNDIWLESV